VQELALSKVAMVAVGDYYFPWQPFESFVKWLPRHKLDPRTRPQLAIKAARVAKVSCNRHFSTQYFRTLHLSASDPRDTIFGILGISNFSGTPIKPDYTKSKDEIFLEAAATMLREAKPAFYCFVPLQPLTTRESLDSSSVRPSWTPNFCIKGAAYTNGIHISVAYNHPATLLHQRQKAWFITWAIITP
jgi:hypothetical protein